ncbi:MAG TPA: hypothetical protein VLM76_02075 [Patescibacteria group bacterium]|nr:hypothetical protein [Patescibacteria group bacterium]
MSHERPIERLVDEEGRVDRAVDLDGWWTRGRATASDGLIGFETVLLNGSPTDTRSRPVASRDGLLEAFGALAAATDDEIARFASRWGPLGLCWHGLPRDHPIEDGHDPDLRRGACFDPYDPEPAVFWRYWAARASNAAAVAAALEEGSVGPLRTWLTLSTGVPWVRHVEEVWSGAIGSPVEAEPDLNLVEQTRLELDPAFLGFDLGEPGGSPASPLPSRQVEHIAFARSRLAGVLDSWLLLGAVRTTLRWDAERPEIAQRSTGLLGAIGVQLMLAIASRGLASCANCGRGFVPSRRPNLHRRTWCSRPECRKASHATAERDRRARRRDKAPTSTA